MTEQIRAGLAELFERDMRRLRDEIAQYSVEDDIWKIGGNITNSAGNLCLHLLGNLNHFIGAVLDESGYVRDRDSEFSMRGVSRDELLAKVEAAEEMIKNALSRLDDETLVGPYPVEVFGHPMTTAYFLIHLATHLNYHLGQINYHRRLLSGE